MSRKLSEVCIFNLYSEISQSNLEISVAIVTLFNLYDYPWVVFLHARLFNDDVTAIRISYWWRKEFPNYARLHCGGINVNPCKMGHCKHLSKFGWVVWNDARRQHIGTEWRIYTSVIWEIIGFINGLGPLSKNTKNFTQEYIQKCRLQNGGNFDSASVF